MDFCRNKNTPIYPNAKDFQGVPGGVMMPRGDIRYEEEEVAGYIITGVPGVR